MSFAPVLEGQIELVGGSPTPPALSLEEADMTGESFYSYEQRFKGPF